MLRDMLIKKVWNDCEELLIDSEVAYGVEEAVEWCESHADEKTLLEGLESQFGAYGTELKQFINEYNAYRFIQWRVSAKKGRWSMLGTVSNMSTGAHDESELVQYLEGKAREMGYSGEFDSLSITELDRW